MLNIKKGFERINMILSVFIMFEKKEES